MDTTTWTSQSGHLRSWQVRALCKPAPWPAPVQARAVDLHFWTCKADPTCLAADKKWGVIGLLYRDVPCSYAPARAAKPIANPTPGIFGRPLLLPLA